MSWSVDSFLQVFSKKRDFESIPQLSTQESFNIYILKTEDLILSFKDGERLSRLFERRRCSKDVKYIVKIRRFNTKLATPGFS